MTLADMKTLAAAAKAATAKPKKSTGPTTAEGKAMSALNAVKHGLSAKHALLPGEDIEDYTRRADAIFAALAPKDDAQAEIVALVADDIHKLARLERVERGLLLGRIEELLAQTETAEDAARTTTAIRTFGSALASWVAEPAPTDRGEEFDRRARRLQTAFTEVTDLLPDLPVDPYAACNRYLTRLADAVAYPVFPADLLAKVYEAAIEFFESILKRGKGVDEQQEQLRKAIATISLPNKEELAKLARYRKMIEEGLARRLATVDHLRKLTVVTSTDAERSAAREYRLRLRVVS